MKTETADLAQITAALEALRQEVARLGQRVAALETAAGQSRSVPASPPSSTAPPAVVKEPISEEILAVLAAAVAAYLGKKAPIRQIRLISSHAWAQQGRVTIQASHNLQS
jgi:methylmalonyl-CoA carboxyltransferase large subunit